MSEPKPPCECVTKGDDGLWICYGCDCQNSGDLAEASAWAASANSAKREAELAAEVERLRKQRDDALDALNQADEINPSNYDHYLVCQLNAAANEAHAILSTHPEQESGE